ncbi:MAG: glycosyltransferase family 2 protein [Deinococcota bacterium]
MPISIIIPTYNPGEQAVYAMCDVLARQTEAFEQLVIIDSSSPDGTANVWENAWQQAATKHEHSATLYLESIPQASFNHGGTRNLAAQRATGEVLVFLTQDALPKDDQWLAELTRPLTQASEVAVAATYARQIAPEEVSVLEHFARSFNYPDTSRTKTWNDLPNLGIKTFFLSNVSSAFLRAPFEEVGGFPERTILNEDMLITASLLKAGYAARYVAEAAVWHGHTYSVSAQFKRYFDIGVSITQADMLPTDLASSGEGLRFVRGQLAFVWQKIGVRGLLGPLPRVIVESAAKWLGFQLGQAEAVLPVNLKRRLSMHVSFWLV